MSKPLSNQEKIKQLKKQINELQVQLEEAKKREGLDPNIEVKIHKNQARTEAVRPVGQHQKTFGHFFIELSITAEQAPVFVPISIASGKKTAGFMYHIEGSAESSLAGASIGVRGTRVTQVKLGTLLFARIPAGVSARFRLRAKIRGKEDEQYQLVISRLNYKLDLAQTRYHRYLKPINSKTVKLK
jgi:hypothetical protein